MQQAQHAALAPVQAAGILGGAAQLLLQTAHPLAKEGAGLGQADAPGLPAQQGEAQFLLQLGDLAAQGRLGHVQGGGGRGEAPQGRRR